MNVITRQVIPGELAIRKKLDSSNVLKCYNLKHIWILNSSLQIQNDHYNHIKHEAVTEKR